MGNSGLGDTATNAIVNATDESGARLNPQSLLNNIPITNIYDNDRNAQVNATDQNTSRLNTTNLATHLRYLNLTGSPAAPEADGGDGGGFFSALAASSQATGAISEPNWISGRSDRMDLYATGPAKLFQQLHDVDASRPHALSREFAAASEALSVEDGALAVDDGLLELLLADLGLE